MGHKILVLGDSGSGKSTSTMNLDSNSTFYVNCIGKALPFKGWKSKYVDISNETNGNMLVSDKWDKVKNAILYVSEKRPEIKTIVVDDAQYIMGYEFMERAKEKGFDKFVEMGKHMFEVLTAPDKTREDLITIFLSHSEDVSGNGYTKTKMKTIGKMLDDKITIEGLFTVVLLASSYRDTDKSMKYIFTTQSDGTTTAKSPMGMFSEVRIPNDLNEVVKQFNAYNLG